MLVEELGITGSHIYNLSQAINGPINDLLKGASKLFIVDQSYLQEDKAP